MFRAEDVQWDNVVDHLCTDWRRKPRQPAPRIVPWPAQCLVNGADQTGSVLIVDGSHPALTRGQAFTIHSFPCSFTVAADVPADATAIPIEPALASAPNDNALITFEDR